MSEAVEVYTPDPSASIAPTAQASELYDTGLALYCSIKGDDIETRKRIYNAMNETESLRDHAKETLYIVDVIAQNVMISDDETGEMKPAIRCVLIDKDGVAYGCTSTGMFSALKNFFALCGQPDEWAEPMPFKIREQTTRKGFRIITFQAG